MTKDPPTEALPPGLLPEGLRDLLPPDAAAEAEAVAVLIGYFAAHGYERVQPPLVEFEAGLPGGAGAAMSAHGFRLMDPVSQRMMLVRSDMTLQVARIATTRLAGQPRPLRLSYGGQVLRVRGSQLRPERQFAQVGAELIGASGPAAEREVILLAAEAVAALGVADLSLDLTMPTLVPTLCRDLGLADDVFARARAALDRKDAAAVAKIGGEGARLLGAMLDAAGPAARAMSALNAIELPKAAAAERAFFLEVVAGVRDAVPELGLTVDPVENRGFEYHTGASFSLFASGARGELGSGGRYQVTPADGSALVSATGFTLFMDSLMRAVPAPEAARRIFLPEKTSAAAGARLRGEGWVTVAGLDPAADSVAEARRMGCGHVLRDGTPVAVVEEAGK
ncbi:MAG: ATP phosphoribosyltransferase regulatory subunit [Alphaproteobacteria bacterium]